MDEGLLYQLLKLWSNTSEKEFGFSPGYKTHPEQFIGPRPAKMAGDLEGWLTELSSNASGVYRPMTNTIWMNPNQNLRAHKIDPSGKWTLQDNLSTYLHENYHARREKFSRGGLNALRNRSLEMFEGKDNYNKFLDSIDIRPKDYYKYSDMFFPDNRENEILAALVGEAGTGNSTKAFRDNLNKRHPKGAEWFDMQTRNDDLLR